MAKRKPWDLNKIPGGFVAVTNEMINSRAYKKLTKAGLKALILCMRKVKTHHPLYRFKLQFELTYPEARKAG